MAENTYKTKGKSWKNVLTKEKDPEIIDKIKGSIEDFREIFRRETRDIGLGNMFYQGKHYGEWDNAALTFKEEDVNEDDRPRLVANMVKVYVDQVIAKVCRYKPSIMTTPMSNDNTDIEGSRVCQDLLHHTFREWDMTDLVERWVKEACISAVGWFLADWDPDKGTEIKVDLLDEEEIMPGVDAEAELTKLFTGDHELRVITGMSIVFDSTAVTWRDSKWVARISERDPTDLKAKYPDKADKIQTNRPENSRTLIGSDTTKEKTTTIYEFWHKPTESFKSGAHVICTDKVVLKKEVKKYPFDHKELPVTPLVYSSRNDFLYGRGIPQDIIELQVEYNKIKNVKLENQNYASALKFLNPLSSNYDSDMMTNEPGEVIEYDGPTPPGWSQPQAVSEELQASLTEIKEEMQEIVGVNSTSQGKPPEGIRSGIAIQYLIENDDTRFAPFIRRMEEGILTVSRQILCNMKQFYEDEDERYYKIVGDNKQYQVNKFKQSNIEGNYDIIIQNSNANPLSKAYKMDVIMQLIQYQLLDTRDRPFVAESLELGNLKGVYEDIELDRLRAKKEIDDILAGKPHDILEYDDHEEHRMTKIRYLKSEDLSKEQRAIVIEAIKAHEEALAQQQSPPEGMPPEGMPPEGPPSEGLPEMAPPEGGMMPGAV